MYDQSADFAWILAFALSPLVAAPWSIVRARRGSVETQRAALRRWLCLGCGVLLWLDAVAIGLALSDPREVGSLSYAPFAGCLTAVLLAVGPYRAGERWKVAASVAVVWAWSLVLPWIPWHPEKRAVLDVHAVVGQPVAFLQERMGQYQAEVLDDDGKVLASGELGELDPVTIDERELRLAPVGGLHLKVAGGIVSDAYFNYD